MKLEHVTPTVTALTVLVALSAPVGVAIQEMGSVASVK